MGEIISAVAAGSVAAGGAGVWGILKLIGLKRERNGSRPVTAAEAEACQKLQAQGYSHIHESMHRLEHKQDRLEEKQDHILEVLIDGRKG